MKFKLFPFVLILFSVFLACAAFADDQKPRAVLLLEHEKPSAWNDMLRKGFAETARKYGFAPSVAIISSGKDLSGQFDKEVAQSALAIVASDKLHETLRDNAAKFRRVKFGSIDAGIRAANIMSVTFKDEEAACLAGNAAAMVAAKLDGPDAPIGWLSGEDSPAMRTLYNGFAECAKLANSKVRLAQALLSSFDDEEGAAYKAGQLCEQGVKVLVLAAGSGNVRAANELAKSDVWLITVDDRLVQPNVLAWLVRRADRAVADIVESASTTFRAKQIEARGLSDAYVDFELTKNLEKKEPQLFGELQRRVRELRTELVKGNMRLPSLRARTLCDCLD